MKAKQARRFTCKQVMRELDAAGSEQTRKTFRRHGVSGDCFGVSYAFLKKLAKQVAHDLPLAEELWASGNHDARVFACWIADADAVTIKLLECWGREVDNHVLSNELVGLAAYTDLGARLSRKWRKLKDEYRRAMGWRIVGSLAMQPSRSSEQGGLLDEELVDCLAEIEAAVHCAPNRTRQAMNQALIAIGCRSTTSERALAVAERVGPVEVDHGDTSCQTDLAQATIRKTLAHYAAQGKLPTDGSAGKRRRHC